MSSGYWRTGKQIEQLKNGNTTTENVTHYLKTWTDRCYSEIPDEVPDKISKANRAPSYKAIAIAILKNDSSLKSLGFEGRHSHWCKILRNKDHPQVEMFQGEM